jgi:REP element-mobilizing transposase RayT
MSHNYFSEINLHIVWHTKGSSPLLTPDVERVTHRILRARATATPGVDLHAIGGIETHIHVCVSVPPTLLLSDWIGRLKGGSAHDVNQHFALRQKVIQWQAGYGVVSFGLRDLEWVRAYVLNQREHHQRGTVFERLEMIAAPDAAPAQAQQGEKPGKPGCLRPASDCLPDPS